MAFIHNSWYAASLSRELLSGSPVAVTIVGEPLVLFRAADGTPAALRDCCCHRNAPLSLGRCEDGLLRCMYHGLLFDPLGRCVHIPGQTHIPKAAFVRSFPAVESSGWIWVWMGDAELADTRRIPRLQHFDVQDWDMRWSQRDMQASYLLMNDNLADMSHVAYLHEASFGGGDRRIAESQGNITRVEHGIRVVRWLADRSKMEHWLPDDPRLAQVSGQDMWLEYDLIAPGIFVMKTEIHASGVARASGYARPQSEPVHANLNIQVMTPCTDTSMRHFFGLGPRRCETIDRPTLADEMFQIMNRGFEEDRQMLEAQQRNLAHWPMQAAAAIQHDRGAHIMRGVIERLIRNELSAFEQDSSPCRPLDPMAPNQA